MIVPSAFEAAPIATSLVRRVQFLRKVVPIELSRFRNHFHDADGRFRVLFQRAPRRDIGVMIQLGDDDFVALLIVAAQRAGEMEGQRRHVRAESDLVRRSVQKIGEGGSALAMIASVSSLVGYAQCVFAL